MDGSGQMHAKQHLLEQTFATLPHAKFADVQPLSSAFTSSCGLLESLVGIAPEIVRGLDAFSGSMCRNWKCLVWFNAKGPLS